jgi:hypothetical protein
MSQEVYKTILVVRIRQMIPTQLVAKTTRIIGLGVREAPNEGTPSFGSNH